MKPRLTSRQRNELALQWLEIWRRAGNPVFSRVLWTRSEPVAGSCSFSVGASGFAVMVPGGDDWSNIPDMEVLANGMNVGPILASLYANREEGNDSSRFISMTLRLLVRPPSEQAALISAFLDGVHIMAAKQCGDPTALAGFDSDQARRVLSGIEKKQLKASIARVRGHARPAARRL